MPLSTLAFKVVSQLLALPIDAEVTHLIAMRDLARQHLLPALPSGPVATGPTFHGSHDLNADADLIAGGMLGTATKSHRPHHDARCGNAGARATPERFSTASAP